MSSLVNFPHYIHFEIYLLVLSFVIVISSCHNTLLKSFSSTISSFSCLLTFVVIFSLNFATNSFIFCKSSFFSQLSCFAVNPFYCTKYFTSSLTFCLFSILSTSYSSTSSTSISFITSFFYLST